MHILKKGRLHDLFFKTVYKKKYRYIIVEKAFFFFPFPRKKHGNIFFLREKNRPIYQTTWWHPLYEAGKHSLPADAAARNARARIDRRRAQTALLTPPQVALS